MTRRHRLDKVNWTIESSNDGRAAAAMIAAANAITDCTVVGLTASSCTAKIAGTSSAIGTMVTWTTLAYIERSRQDDLIRHSSPWLGRVAPSHLGDHLGQPAFHSQTVAAADSLAIRFLYTKGALRLTVPESQRETVQQATGCPKRAMKRQDRQLRLPVHQSEACPNSAAPPCSSFAGPAPSAGSKTASCACECSSRSSTWSQCPRRSSPHLCSSARHPRGRHLDWQEVALAACHIQSPQRRTPQNRPLRALFWSTESISRLLDQAVSLSLFASTARSYPQ